MARKSQQQRGTQTRDDDGESTIWVVTGDDTAMRAHTGLTALKVDELSRNMDLFLRQIGSLLERCSSRFGEFEFSEFEIRAEVSGKGRVSLFGTGGEAGATGGLKLLFKRAKAVEPK